MDGWMRGMGLWWAEREGKTKGFIKTKSLKGEYRFSSYKVKKDREKLRCLLLLRKKKIIFFIFVM